MKKPSQKAIHHATQLITISVLIINMTLYALGIISGPQAVLLFFALESPLIFLSFGLIGAGICTRMRNKATFGDAALDVFKQSPFAPAVSAEIRTYRSLALWVRGRFDTLPPGATPITASSGTLFMPLAFITATLIEVAVLHLLIPWAWLKLAAAIVSIWSLVIFLGFLAVHRVNPHYYTADAIVLRQSGKPVTEIRLGDLTHINQARRFTETVFTVRDGRLFLPNGDGTNLDLHLATEADVKLPSIRPSRRHSDRVTAVSLHVDDPRSVELALNKAKASVR